MKNLVINTLAIAALLLALPVAAIEAISVTISLSVYLAPEMTESAPASTPQACEPLTGELTSTCETQLATYTLMPADGNLMLTIAPI